MKYHNLPERPAPGVYMMCPVCWERYSATKGDYFTRNQDREMTCCDEPCVLVHEKRVLEVIEQ